MPIQAICCWRLPLTRQQWDCDLEENFSSGPCSFTKKTLTSDIYRFFVSSNFSIYYWISAITTTLLLALAFARDIFRAVERRPGWRSSSSQRPPGSQLIWILFSPNSRKAECCGLCIYSCHYYGKTGSRDRRIPESW